MTVSCISRLGKGNCLVAVPCSFRLPLRQYHRCRGLSTSSSSLSLSLSSTSSTQHQTTTPIHRRHLIFGANTDVGKTVVAAGLVRSSRYNNNNNNVDDPTQRVHYVKPMQCGGSDESFVKNVVALPSPTLHNKNDGATATATTTASPYQADTLFDWETFASPHTASRQEGLPISDRQVVEALQKYLLQTVAATAGQNSSTVTWCETAGGVLSPAASSPDNDSPLHARTSTAPSSSPLSWGWQPQADLYATFASSASAVLVGDGKLGGISATLSSLESLLWRGYRVPAVVLIAPFSQQGKKDIHQNAAALREYTQGRFVMNNLLVFDLPSIPPDPAVPLDEWYQSDRVSSEFARLNQHLADDWRMSPMMMLNHQLDSSSSSLSSSSLPLGHVTSTMNSKGLAFRLARTCSMNAQALGEVESSQSTAAQIDLTDQLLESSALPFQWADTAANASWVYRTEDVEADARTRAQQLAFATYQKRMRVTEDEMSTLEWAVCGHSTAWTEYETETNDVDGQDEQGFSWVSAEALTLDAPTIAFAEGKLRIRFPEGLESSPDTVTEFNSIEQALDVVGRRISPKLYSQYKELIEMQWLIYEHAGINRKIGAIVIEPVLSRERVWVDPLWQRALIDIGEARNIPIIFDEMNMGLEMKRGSQVLGVDPDIAMVSLPSISRIPIINALCTDEVAKVEETGPDETGVIYSGAHGIDCVAAGHAIDLQFLTQTKKSPTLAFPEDKVLSLSKLDHVQECFALGNLLSVSFSNTDTIDRLRKDLESRGLSVHQEDGNRLVLVVDSLLGNEERHKVLDICTRLLS